MDRAEVFLFQNQPGGCGCLHKQSGAWSIENCQRVGVRKCFDSLIARTSVGSPSNARKRQKEIDKTSSRGWRDDGNTQGKREAMISGLSRSSRQTESERLKNIATQLDELLAMISDRY
jgi:hypothetical protein